MKEQKLLEWPFLINLMRDLFKNFAGAPPEKLEGDDSVKELIRNYLNLISISANREKLNPEDKSIFTGSINFLLNYYVFQQIDNMEVSEEVKNKMKGEIKDAVKIVLPAFFKQRNGEKLSPEDRNRFLRSILPASTLEQ